MYACLCMCDCYFFFKSSEEQLTSQSPRLLASSTNATGSESRQLPNIPSLDINSMAGSTKANTKQVPPVRGTTGYGPFLQEYSLMAE